MKARGQLKVLIRTWPRGSAPALLEFALANWVDVRTDAEHRFGAFNSPAAPELGDLVRYAHVVADLFSRRGAALLGTANAPPPSPPPEAATQSIGGLVPAPAEKFFTLADVLALDGEAA